MLDEINSLWVGDELSIFEQLSISSFLKNGHKFNLYTYNHIRNIPDGTTIKDANEIIKEDHIFIDSKGSLGSFSDLFRWKMISMSTPGYWVDTDVICIKPFDFKEDIVFGMQNASIAAVGVLKFPSDHIVTREMLDLCENPKKIRQNDSNGKKIKKAKKAIKKLFIKDDSYQFKWGELGPKAFTKITSQTGTIKKAKSFIHFYPIASSNWNSIFDDTFSDEDITIFKNTYAIHLWNERLRRDGFDKNSEFPEHSYIERLKRLYL